MGEYEFQIYKYQPLAFWRVNGSSSIPETSFYNIQSQIVKTSTAVGYKSIINSLHSETDILFEGNTILLQDSEFSAFNFGSSSTEKQQFSINFWYKNLNNVIDTQIPIFSIGTSINLYTKNGNLLLDFLGEKSFIPVKDYRDIMNITVSYDGSHSKLMVNGISAQYLSQISSSFTSSPSVIWIAGAGCEIIIQGISFFGYTMTSAQASLLYSIGSFKSNLLENIYTNLGMYTLNYSPPNVNKSFTYSPNKNNSIFRNCTYENGIISMSTKPYALNNAIWNIDRYKFNADSHIDINISDMEIDIFDTSIKVSCPDLYTGEGTILYIDGNKPVRVYAESNVLYIDIAGNIFSKEITTMDSYFSIDLADRSVNINISGTIYETELVFPSKFVKMYLGNNKDLSDPYSGGIDNFSINYLNNPLQIGIYQLDLTNQYGQYIKPIYDATVIMQVYIPSGTTINYLELDHGGGVEVMSFTDVNTKDEYYACINGTDIKDGDQVVDSIPSTESVVLLSARLFDNVISDSLMDISHIKINKFNLYGFNNKALLVHEIDAKASSDVDYPYNMSTDKTPGLLVKHPWNIVNVDYSITEICSIIKIIDIKNNSSSLISLGSSSIFVIKETDTSYRLRKTSNGSIIVNGEEYAYGEDSHELFINDEVFIVGKFTENELAIYIDYSKCTLDKLAFGLNIDQNILSDINKYMNGVRTEFVIDNGIVELSDDIVVKSFTSNIILSS